MSKLKPNSKDALAAAVKYLKADRWLKDSQAGADAKRASLMRMAGHEVAEENGIPVVKYTGRSAESVIAYAVAGDQVAHQALCLIAQRLTDNKETLPPALQGYVVRVAAQMNAGKRGKRTAGTNDLRDDAILDAVEIVMKFGFGAMRNDARKQESACSIVVQALGECGAAISEKTVNSIYTKRRRAFARAGIARV